MASSTFIGPGDGLFRTAGLVISLLCWFTGAPRAVQAPPIDRAALAARVKTEFLHAWSGYTLLAAGHDELNPLSGTPHDWTTPVIFHMTPLDAFDTMWLMGLTDEAAKTKAMLVDTL